MYKTYSSPSQFDDLPSRLSDLSTWYTGLLTVLVDYLQHRALTSVEVVTATEDDWTLLSADDRSAAAFTVNLFTKSVYLSMVESMQTIPIIALLWSTVMLTALVA